MTDRQQELLSLIRRDGAVRVKDMARRFRVTTQTIRRDLNALCDAGMARRTHGGARAPDSARVSNLDYRARRALRRDAKQAVARVAAGLIPGGCSLMLNIGTTTEQVAVALGGHAQLVVISNNINIISTMMSAAPRELILVGGAVRCSDGAVIGEQAVEFIARYKADYAVIGCSALDEDGAVLDFDSREVSVARAMLRNARTRVLVCDHSKFARTAPMRICNLDDLDFVVIDRRPGARFMQVARAAGTRVLVAGQERATAGAHVEKGRETGTT